MLLSLSLTSLTIFTTTTTMVNDPLLKGRRHCDEAAP
jgi:hypothetical protein